VRRLTSSPTSGVGGRRRPDVPALERPVLTLRSLHFVEDVREQVRLAIPREAVNGNPQGLPGDAKKIPTQYLIAFAERKDEVQQSIQQFAARRFVAGSQASENVQGLLGGKL
jgi:hypothetical protein